MSKNLSRKVTIYINGKEVESTIKSLEAEVRKLKNQQKNLTIGTEEYIKTGLKIREIQSVLQAQKNAVNDLQPGWKSLCESVAEYSNIIMGIQSATEMLDGVIGSLKDLATEAAELDDAYADVQKTTGLTHEEVERLNESFKKMDTRTSREELNKLAYEAGKLGINSEQAVLQFVRASDKINIALGDVLGEGAMVAIGKMADVYTQTTEELKVAGDDLEKKMLAIGSAVNQLGQESTANERYMVDFTARMGGIAVQAGMSAGQVLGFASALDQSMQKVEMSATAFQKFIGQIMKKPEEFAQQAGMAVGEFQRLVKTDLNEALFRVLEGFKGKGGYAELVNIFKDLGLDGARAATVISSMANNIDKISDAQWIANEQLRERNSIENEFEVKNNNRQAQREKALKAYKDIRIELGDTLYPILINLTRLGTTALKGVSGLVEVIKYTHGAILIPMVATLGALMRVRLLNIATSLKEKLSIEGNIIARRKESVESRRVELQLAKERVQRLQALKTRLEERIATNNLVLAKRQELIASGQTAKVYAAETTARRLNAAMTRTQNMLLDAQRSKTIALSAVMKSTPWGLIAAGVTAVIALFARHNQQLQEAREREQELAQEEARVAESSSKAKVEIERYTQRIKERIEKGGDEKTLVEQLNKKYGETFGTYDTLAQWYDVLTSKVEDYVQALLLEAKAKKNIDNAAEMDAQIEAYKKMKAESMEEVESLNGLQKAWYNLRANAYGVRQKVSGFLEGGTTNTPGRIFDFTGAREGWQNNGPQQEVDRLWNAYFDNQEEQKRRVIAGMEEVRDAYIKSSEDMMRESAELQQKGGFKVVQGDFVNAEDMPTGGDGGASGESAKEREKRLKAAAKEWAKVKAAAEKLVSQASLKAESGLAKVADEVGNEFDEMRQKVLSAAVAAGKVKLDENGEIESMTEEVKALTNEMDAAEAKWRDSKVQKYIEKLNQELEKQRQKYEKVNGSANPYLKKIEEAQRNIVSVIKEIDGMVAAAEADIDTLDQAIAKSEGERRKQLEKEKQVLLDLIARYKQLKGEARDAALNGITSGVAAQPLKEAEPALDSHGQKQYNKAKPLGLIYDKSVLEQYKKSLADINKEYNKQKSNIEQAAEAAQKANNTAEVERLRGELEKLDKMREDAEADLERNTFGTFLEKMTKAIEEFGDKAMQIWSSLTTYMNNKTQEELNNEKKAYDEKSNALQEQLDNGIISQEEYEEQKEQLQEEYDEKEKALQLEQWKREKALNLGQATIEAALAVLKALSSAPPPYNAILAAISAAAAAVQIAAIASEPEPYAQGGYVEKRTVYQAGEAGREWVASNSLLNDPTTAPIIEGLEAYQRGRGLNALRMAQLNVGAAEEASTAIGRAQFTTATQQGTAQPVVNVAPAVSDPQMLAVLRELTTYMKDPKNRQAVISRRTLEDFNSKEQFLRNRARL